MWVQDADQSCCTNGLSQYAHRTMVAHQFLMVIYPSSAPLPRAFDVELLYIARYFNIPIAEVAVNWEEIEGNFCLRLIDAADFIIFRIKINSLVERITDGKRFAVSPPSLHVWTMENQDKIFIT